ncbi:MAG: thioredoxin-like domain-containing protein [Fluviicola sp.]
MKQLLVIALLLVSTFGFGQKIRFKVEGVKDTTVFLTKYYGSKLFYADTAQMKGGIVEFTAKKDLKPGIIALLMPGQKFFDVIYNNEEISIETKGPDFVANMKVKKSEENKVFIAYINYLQEQRKKANEIAERRKKFKEGDPEYKSLGGQMDSISKLVATYQTDLQKNNPTKLVSKIIKMSMDVTVPEAPKDASGKVINPNYRYEYYRAHYFDNIDLKDDRLVNTSVFGSKVEYFFGKNMLVQHPDTILAFAFPFCDQLDKKSEMFKYAVDYITNTFAKSNIMGLDKVYVLMVERYYCKKDAAGNSIAYWMKDKEKLDELCKENEIKKRLVQGVVPPNISLRDTTDVNWRDFASLKSEYTILYFWDPECGHCKKTTPKLQTLYEKKFKARNVEIFSVGKATGDDFEKWKKFIRDNKLSFINVGLTKKLFEDATADPRQFIPKYTTLEALNYHDTYDIYATPRIFVLDKDKKIIAKQLTISQLEDFIDRMQNIKDAEKLFPPDPEEEAH